MSDSLLETKAAPSLSQRQPFIHVQGECPVRIDMLPVGLELTIVALIPQIRQRCVARGVRPTLTRA
jgi:hypothetical protein